MTDLRLEVSSSHNASATPDASGQYPVKIVRRRLYAAAVAPSNYRYNSTTGVFQFYRISDGAWVDNPNVDPRNQRNYPALVGSDRACRAAKSMIEAIRAKITLIVQGIGIGATIIGIASTIIGYIATALGGWLWPLAVALAVDMVAVSAAAGVVALDLAFSAAMYSELLCILYCNIGVDGQVSTTQLATIKAQINDDIGGLAASVLQLWLGLIGAGGLSDFGTFDIGTGSCAGCDCAWCAVTSGDALPGELTIGRGTDVAGGIATVIRVANDTSAFLIKNTNTSTTVNHVEFTYTLTTIGPLGSRGRAQILKNGVEVAGNLISATGTFTLVWNGVSALNDSWVVIIVPSNSGSTIGVGKITSVKINGIGSNPFTFDNC